MAKEMRPRLYNTSWMRAWREAGLPRAEGVQKGPHNLRHTFGRRLRAADVPQETRRVLLGHRTDDLTTHYSAAELRELIDAVERIVQRPDKLASTVLRLVHDNECRQNAGSAPSLRRRRIESST